MYSRQRTRGFTLIELLVVVTIMLLIAAIAVNMLRGASPRSRDARRLAELGQMARQLAEYDENPALVLSTCGAPATYPSVTACTVPDFSTFLDPSNATASCGATPTLPCQYSISTAIGGPAITTDNWQIKTYLEADAGELGPGPVCVSSEHLAPHSEGCL